MVKRSTRRNVLSLESLESRTALSHAGVSHALLALHAKPAAAHVHPLSAGHATASNRHVEVLTGSTGAGRHATDADSANPDTASQDRSAHESASKDVSGKDSPTPDPSSVDTSKSADSTR